MLLSMTYELSQNEKRSCKWMALPMLSPLVSVHDLINLWTWTCAGASVVTWTTSVSNDMNLMSKTSETNICIQKGLVFWALYFRVMWDWSSTPYPMSPISVIKLVTLSKLKFQPIHIDVSILTLCSTCYPNIDPALHLVSTCMTTKNAAIPCCI